MKQPQINNGLNQQQKPKTSVGITYWSDKYNATLDEIQEILNGCGSSISKTLQVLRARLLAPGKL